MTEMTEWELFVGIEGYPVVALFEEWSLGSSSSPESGREITW